MERQTGNEIVNVSVVGGGATTSIFNYLQSDDFKKHPPKYLIWETSTVSVNMPESAWVQLTGLVEGECKGGTIAEVQFDANAGGLLHFPQSLELNSGSFLHLAYEDRTVSSVQLKLSGAALSEKSYDLSIPPLAIQSGDFQAELPLQMSANSTIIVAATKGHTGMAKLSLCKSNLTNASGLASQNTAPKVKTCADVTSVQSKPYDPTHPGPSIAADPTISAQVKFAKENSCVVLLQPHYPTSGDTKLADSETQRQFESMKDLASIRGFTGEIKLMPPDQSKTAELSFSVTEQ